MPITRTPISGSSFAHQPCMNAQCGDSRRLRIYAEDKFRKKGFMSMEFLEIKSLLWPIDTERLHIVEGSRSGQPTMSEEKYLLPEASSQHLLTDSYHSYLLASLLSDDANLTFLKYQA